MKRTSMNIELRRWSSADREALRDLCNAVDRTFLSDRLPQPYTDGDAEWWLNRVETSEGIDGVFRAIVADHHVVGSISVERKADVYRFDGDLGYFLLTDYWNQGIMTEAVHQACELAFESLQLNRITASVFQPNTASHRVLVKNGFQQEGIMRRAAAKDDRIFDVCIYGLVKE